MGHAGRGGLPGAALWLAARAGALLRRRDGLTPPGRGSTDCSSRRSSSGGSRSSRRTWPIPPSTTGTRRCIR
ncbi:hypothetical protein D7X12_35510, partial [Corallococcus sicarius]